MTSPRDPADTVGVSRKSINNNYLRRIRSR